MITSLSNLIENTYIRYTRNQQDMYLLLEFIVAATTVFRKSETIYICSVGNHFFSNTRQNGEWTETITCQDEKELAMFGEFLNSPTNTK